MVDLDDVARHALSLDGVRERTVGGRRGWYVGGRLVARVHDTESIVVRCEFAPREHLVASAPETFSVPPELEAHHKVLADLGRGDPDAVLAAISAAWELQRG